MKEEKDLKCPFCPCHFSTEYDFKLHMDAFGRDEKTHYYRFKEVHKSLERWR